MINIKRMKLFFLKTSQYKKGVVRGKNLGSPLLKLARKIKTPDNNNNAILFFFVRNDLYINNTARRVKIPMVFSCILFE